MQGVKSVKAIPELNAGLLCSTASAGLKKIRGRVRNRRIHQQEVKHRSMAMRRALRYVRCLNQRPTS
ncbi:CGH_1_HP_G0076450.mRNA.1.CDS.1 [Saccharomyces cerevisiae]|nr:CGH_1_HP_G0076450.mRNA.1.CDS.1 [Saccharomyces cerevisiae]CAI6913846.1 CGH_1_HP_G0076450.mRNA.1.CDS.1 [Saccharomyces cerevisiae]